MSGPRISLCMIARDEAPILRACLDAARDAVDEIVLIDTGSRDETPRIAREAGAKVFHYPWQDDFSQARNHSLDHATGEWFLWLDADEVLQEGGAAAIRRAVQDPKAAGFYLRLTNVLDGGALTNYLMPRLFLRRPEFRFVNVIHEQILAPVERHAQAHGLHIGVCDAQVLHYGYSDSEIRRKSKHERMEKLFRKQLDLFPDDPYSWYKFGDFARQKDRAKGICALQKSLDLIRAASRNGTRPPGYTPEVAALLATEEQHRGRDQEARSALASVSELGCAESPNFWFAKACVSRLQHDYKTGVEYFSKCLGSGSKIIALESQWGISGPLAWYGIAECKSALGDSEGARRAFLEAVHLAPQHTEIVLSYATFLFRQGEAVECLETLTGYLATNPPPCEMWTKYGNPLFHLAVRAIQNDIRKWETKSGQPR